MESHRERGCSCRCLCSVSRLPVPASGSMAIPAARSPTATLDSCAKTTFAKGEYSIPGQILAFGLVSPGPVRVALLEEHSCTACVACLSPVVETTIDVAEFPAQFQLSRVPPGHFYLFAYTEDLHDEGIYYEGGLHRWGDRVSGHHAVTWHNARVRWLIRRPGRSSVDAACESPVARRS